MKNMTKDRYNTIAARLLLITLLSTFVCVVMNSYIPLIITGAAFVGFLIFARKRYGYRAVESRELTKDERKVTVDFSELDEENTANDLIYNPNYYWHDSNIYHK